MSDELTTQVKCILHNPGVSGGAVTRKTVIAIVNGVLKARCPEMLEENERKITLTTKWTRGVLKSLDRIKRRDTTGKREMNPALYELIFSCKRKIANAIFEHRIQKEMILNFDQTARGFTAWNKSTFTGKGVHSVPTANVDDKRQITATFCVKIVGNFLPVDVIYGSVTDKCNTQHAWKIDLNNAELSEFTKIFLSILDKHAPKNKSLYEQITLIS